MNPLDLLSTHVLDWMVAGALILALLAALFLLYLSWPD